MNDQKFCQSCAMPLTSDDMLGTNADGSKNADYCQYCYQNGAYTSDLTMEQMIDFCAPHMAAPGSGLTAEEAKARMQGFFPQLKR